MRSPRASEDDIVLVIKEVACGVTKSVVLSHFDHQRMRGPLTGIKRVQRHGLETLPFPERGASPLPYASHLALAT